MNANPREIATFLYPRPMTLTTVFGGTIPEAQTYHPVEGKLNEDDDEYNRAQAWTNFHAWAKLLNVRQANTRAIMQSVIGLTAAFEAFGYGVETTTIQTHWKVILENWPDQIPKKPGNRGYKYANRETVTTLMPEFGYFLNKDGRQLQLTTMVKGALVWRSRRTRYDNFWKAAEIAFEARQEMGAYTREFWDRLIRAIDGVCDIRSFLIHRESATRNYFKVGDFDQWTHAMFKVPMITKKQGGYLEVQQNSFQPDTQVNNRNMMHALGTRELIRLEFETLTLETNSNTAETDSGNDDQTPASVPSGSEHNTPDTYQGENSNNGTSTESIHSHCIIGNNADENSLLIDSSSDQGDSSDDDTPDECVIYQNQLNIPTPSTEDAETARTYADYLTDDLN